MGYGLSQPADCFPLSFSLAPPLAPEDRLRRQLYHEQVSMFRREIPTTVSRVAAHRTMLLGVAHQLFKMEASL